MSTSPKRLSETDGAKEEDWEVVSGSKSLSLEASLGPQKQENEQNVKNSEEEEKKVKEEEQKKEALSIKTEEALENEQADWYQTIPATPMNTPEFTPLPPSYLSSNSEFQKGVEAQELSPITEEVLEDQTPNVSGAVENSHSPEDGQEDLESKDSNVLQKYFDVLRFIFTRLAVFIVVFSLIRWSFMKACEKFKKLKRRPDSKTAVN